MAFNVSTNDNRSFSVSAGFQNYTSLISSYNNIGIGQTTTTTTTTTNVGQNWVLHSPVPSLVYNCTAVTTDGTIQVACTKDTIYLYKNNRWTPIYNTSTPGVSFSYVCLSDDGVCITASDFITGLYVSTNSGSSFAIIAGITFPKNVCMSKDGLYQTVISSGFIYTTANKWVTFVSNNNPTFSKRSLCMSYNGSIQFVFMSSSDRPPLALVYLSNDYGTTFKPINQPITLNVVTACNCSSDGKIVTAVSTTGIVYLSTNPTVPQFTQVFSATVRISTVFNVSLSATGIQQWCIIGADIYQSTDTGSTWTRVTNLPAQVDVWSQAFVSGDNSNVLIVGLDTINTIGYIYYLSSSTSSTTTNVDKQFLHGLGQSVNYTISLDRLLGL
jgi:photosystem II stability/assembly factor-like uncharacterized protein